ncbi:hypothetical protein H0H92_013232, partial [Tricholoma furcatifolium]
TDDDSEDEDDAILDSNSDTDDDSEDEEIAILRLYGEEIYEMTEERAEKKIEYISKRTSPGEDPNILCLTVHSAYPSLGAVTKCHIKRACRFEGPPGTLALIRRVLNWYCIYFNFD